MTKRVERAFAGQTLSATRYNRLVDAINEQIDAAAGSVGTDPGFRPREIIAVEIKALAAIIENPVYIDCVLPGESANVDAVVYRLNLPQIYTETSRVGVSYLYTDLNTRTATSAGQTDETQFLTPPLTVGEIVAGWDDYGTWRMLGDGRMWAVDPPASP